MLTNPRFFDFVLDIESENKATVKTKDGVKLPGTSFNVEDQRITGSLKTTEPQDTIGLSTPPPKYDVEFELSYIEDILIGQVRLSPEKSTVRLPGTLNNSFSILNKRR